MDSAKTSTGQEKLLFATFNQDNTWIAISTEKGFQIFNSYPFRDSFKRNLDGGISIIEMLNRCQIVALVGLGKNPKFAPNKVILWDDAQSKIFKELRFTTYVKNIKLKRDKIFVICQLKIYVFNFNQFENIDELDTYENQKGLIGISKDNSNIIAYPDAMKGYLKVKNYDKSTLLSFKVHENDINCISMSNDGTIIATASTKGTIIRVFKSSDGTCVQELRRGSEAAEIYSIAFDNDNKYIACSSDRSTIHIFNWKTDINTSEGERPQNQKSFLGKITNFLGVQNEYLNSEWSFAQFRIPDEKSICSFGPDNTIIAISYCGKYYQASFDPKVGGECVKIQEQEMWGKE